MIQLNKYSTSVDDETLKLELQLVLTKIELTNMKVVETLLDSLYMCSTLTQIIKATISIYKSCQYYSIPVKEFYSNWLSKKIELVDNTTHLYSIAEDL